MSQLVTHSLTPNSISLPFSYYFLLNRPLQKGEDTLKALEGSLGEAVRLVGIP